MVPRVLANTVASMTVPIASRREAVDALLTRLRRIQACSVTLASAAGDIRADGAPASLLEALNNLERDLLLAARETDEVRHHLRP